MMYNQKAIQRLTVRSKVAMDYLLANMRVANDYGETARRMLYNDLVLVDPILNKIYKEILSETEPTHNIKETPATKAIEWLINMYGWRGFLDAFTLYAKNKEAKLLGHGLKLESETWAKVSARASAMPKNPQM